MTYPVSVRTVAEFALVGGDLILESVSMERMREGAIAPVDLAQATIGPGMAVFSRHAWQGARFVAEDGAPQRFAAQVQAPGGAFTLHVLHPMPPISAEDRAARDALLARMAGDGASAATTRGAVLMGDLNTTPWASGLRGMAAQGWGRASGLAPTLEVCGNTTICPTPEARKV